MLRLLIAHFVMVFLLAPLAFANSASFSVTGTRRIADATVISYAEPYLAQGYTKEGADAAIKALFGTGFFSDVKISAANGKVAIWVQENPIVNKVVFEGNRKIKDADLRKEIFLLERSVFSLSKVQKDVQRIAGLYNRKGYRTAMVEPKLINVDDNRVNLVYEIAEGKATRIKEIVFSGNQAFSSAKLKKVISSSESKWWRFFSNDDVYDPDRMLYDQEQLRQFYMQNGYADFNVAATAAELSNAKDAFLLTYAVHEGEVYKYGDVKIESLIAEFDTSKLQHLIVPKKGKFFNVLEVEETVDQITNYLGEHGYVFVDVDVDYAKHQENLTVDVVLQIQESPRVYVNKINIKNNTRTQDKVIRREFRLHEGDPYNASKMQRSKQRVQNLGYFSAVDFKNVMTSRPDKVDIDVEVQETSTGSIRFGIGYNTATGPLGQVVLSENNFLGKGQSVVLALEKTGRSYETSFSFTEPYFMDRNLAVGFEVSLSQFKGADKNKFSPDKSKITYNSDQQGLRLFMGYELSEHLYHNIHYLIQRERLGRLPENANDFVRSQKLKNVLSMVGHSLTYDKRDNRLDPRSGYVIAASQDVAGVGGNKRYLKHSIGAAWHIPLYKKDVVLNLRGKAGNVTGIGGKKVGMSDGFLLSPDGYIRGFEYGGIGPRDAKSADSISSKNFYAANIEVTFPLGLAKELGLRGEVFLDVASAFGTDATKAQKAQIYDKSSLRASFGVGILWSSSMFGNVEIAYAPTLRKENFDRHDKLVLNFSKAF